MIIIYQWQFLVSSHTNYATLSSQTISARNIRKLCPLHSMYSTRKITKKSSACPLRPYEAIRISSPSCTRRVIRASSKTGRSPHRGIGRHPVGADRDSLNVDRRRRHLVRSHSARLAYRASHRAEKVAACAVGGNSNASSVLVALGQARLNSVRLCLAAVSGIVRRAGEALITVDSVCGAACIGVVAVVVGRAESSGWRCS